MLFRRTLGVAALTSVIIAAVSFAIVDVSIANANGCLGLSVKCVDATVPVVAMTFAIIGVIALMGSIIPAITWFVGTIRAPHDDLEPHPVRVPLRASYDPFEDDE